MWCAGKKRNISTSKNLHVSLRFDEALRRSVRWLCGSLCSAVSAACLPPAPGVRGRAPAAVREAAVPGGGTEGAPPPADPGPALVPGGDAETEQLPAQSSPNAPQVAASRRLCQGGWRVFKLVGATVGGGWEGRRWGGWGWWVNWAAADGWGAFWWATSLEATIKSWGAVAVTSVEI